MLDNETIAILGATGQVGSEYVSLLRKNTNLITPTRVQLNLAVTDQNGIPMDPRLNGGVTDDADDENDDDLNYGQQQQQQRVINNRNNSNLTPMDDDIDDMDDDGIIRRSPGLSPNINE